MRALRHPANLLSMCPSCSTTLPPLALSCPSCRQLVHAQELESLSQRAKVAEAGGALTDARAAWARALTMLPQGTLQHSAVEARLADLDARLAPTAPKPPEDAAHSPWAKRFAQFGPLGVFLWKFKVILLFAATKGKLLLLGLTNLTTLTSMLASMGLYWHWYGWKFALGFVLSIYVHEMGHVACLRRYGIAATAPMFVPGFGALVLLKQRPATVMQDARVGLAGPIWGLGAAIAAALVGALTASPLCFAVAHAGAWINLFNLIPVWQLDGGRGFRALTRRQRGIGLACAVAMWAVTQESMLLLLSLGAGYRLFTKDYPAETDRGALFQYAGLVVALSLLWLLCRGAAVLQ
jgi:Zn-dependent protease